MNTRSNPNTKTRIIFDLADELTPEEIQKFEQAAKEAGAPNLTEHFLNLTLRFPPGGETSHPHHKEAA